MTLSIIVPVYNMNHDGNLRFCLDSLINQNIKDKEIIAVDDASTDDSLAVLREYEEKYPAVFRVISYPDNRHQGGAKNEGLKAACGEWIGFIDSDDWITPDFYERLLSKAEESGADMVGCTYSIVHSHTFETGKIIENNTPEQTGILMEGPEDGENIRTGNETMKKLLLNPGSMVIKIYKADVIRKNHLSFPEGIFYEDNCASRVWAAHFTHFEYINEPLYYYYQHNDSTVHTITEERCRDRMRAMDIMLEEFKKRGLYEAYRDELECAYTELYFRITLFSYMIGCRKKRMSFVRELKRGLLTNFPDFRSNKYYKVPDAEENKMVNLCMKSVPVFYVYYSLLWKYRRMRTKS